MRNIDCFNIAIRIYKLREIKNDDARGYPGKYTIDARILSASIKLPQSFFDSMRSGEILSRMADAARINCFYKRYTPINRDKCIYGNRLIFFDVFILLEIGCNYVGFHPNICLNVLFLQQSK